MSDNTLVLSLLLPLIFILHNIEEYLSYDKFKYTYNSRIGGILFNKSTFLFAIIFLSILVTAIAVADLYIKNYYLQITTLILVFSVLINGIQHIVVSLISKKILPGTFTSVFLIVPFSIIFIYNCYGEILFGIKSIMLYLIISSLVVIISIYLSILFGYLLFNLINFIKGSKNG